MADNMHETAMYELACVGYCEFVGEVIRIEGEELPSRSTRKPSRKRLDYHPSENAIETCSLALTLIWLHLCLCLMAGLTVGDAVLRTGKPLSAELGLGLMSNNSDGIQLPLKVGDHITGVGDFGAMYENSLVTNHLIISPSLSRNHRFHCRKGLVHLGGQ
ncbi:H(+)-transporting V1 sector ATPase subunit A, partial [Mortierella sp. AD094]